MMADDPKVKVRTRTLSEGGQWVESDVPEERRPKPRRFVLDRKEDKTGVSGTGVVAEGILFTDGTTVLRWTGEFGSVVIYRAVEDVIAVHGHRGSTELVWLD
jgi:hypothetical protein